MPVPTSYLLPISASKYLLLIRFTAQINSGGARISNWVIPSQLYIMLRSQPPQGVLEKKQTFTKYGQLEKGQVP